MLQTTPDPQERSPPKPPRSKNPAQSTCNPRPRSRCNNGCNTLCSSSCNPIQRRREAIPGNKPAAAQAPCTPPPPGNTPHGQPISFSQPIILKDDRREDQPGHAVDLPDPAADGAVRWGRLRPGPGQMAVRVRGLRRAGERGWDCAAGVSGRVCTPGCAYL